MTIKVEREALLRVISTSSSTRASYHPPSLSLSPVDDEEEYLLIDYDCSKPPSISPEVSVESVPIATCASEEFARCRSPGSVCTLSTASLSDDLLSDDDLDDIDDDESSQEPARRTVSFADDVVSDVWTRPFTPKEEVSCLFYSTEETQRFRQEYRLERKLCTELSVDPETFPVDNEEELSALVSTSQPSGTRHSISHVVVLHNDKLEAFFNHPTAEKEGDQVVEPELGDDFFDNDSFWSGSITWY